MKIFKLIFICAIVLSLAGPAYAGDVYDDESSDSGGSGGQVLGGALMGGLLGGGLGAAIGSASGHAGKGALIGAGVGAVGGTLVGASQADRQRAERSQSYSEPENYEDYEQPRVKKKVIREYDDQGNVISEREVAQ